MDLYYGGYIYTLEEEQQQVESILVNDGEIYRTGAFDDLKSFATTFHHLEGRTMIPGLVDSHIHLIGYGQQLRTVSLQHATCQQEIMNILLKASNLLNENEWLIAEGWNEFNLKDEMPSLQQLDTIHRPVLLHRICRHVLLANTKAMQLAGITNATLCVEGGQIGQTEAGQLTGYFYDEATAPLNKAALTEGDAFKAQVSHDVETAIRQLHQYGIVGAHSEDCAYYGAFENVIHAYNETIGKHKHFRVHLLRHHQVFEQMIAANIKELEQFIEFGAMKIFADGSFGGSTAALLESYNQDYLNKGMLIHSEEEFEKLVQVARNHNEAIAVHMIGDRAAQLVISMIEKYPTPIGKRDRLIHACLLNESLLSRMKALPRIIVDIQPAFVPSDFPWVKEKLGESRLAYAYAWKKLKDCHIALGTDAPIEQVKPLQTIYAAVKRNEYSEFPTNEELTIFEAFQAYTIGSAYAINKEHERGLIKEGFVADFTIFDRNPFEENIELLPFIQVTETIVNGKTVYKK